MERLNKYTPKQAARIIGASLVAMFFIALITQFMIFENLIVAGDATATITNIETNESLFWASVVGWLIVYTLDVVTSLGIYVLFKSTNKSLANASSILRLTYTGIVLIGLIALVMRKPGFYDIGQLGGYLFFIAHLCTLGYLVFNSDYTPRWLGVLLMVGSISYIVLTYGEFFIPQSILDPLFMVAMIPAALGELIFAIWLLLRSNKFP